MSTDALDRLRAIQEARKARGGGGSWSNYFRVGEGKTEVIRILDEFIEQVIPHQTAVFHKTPAGDGAPYGSFEICLAHDPEAGVDTGAPCPGCEKNAEDSSEYWKQHIYYINVIWRNAPVRKKVGDKWVETDERKDQLAVWQVNQKTLQEAVENAAATYKSITNRDFVITRKGTGRDTTYTMNPAVNEEGDSVKTPLTDADKELAEKKPDLSERVKLPAYEDWGKKRGGGKKQEAAADGDTAKSPFLNRNQNEDSE